MFSMMSNSSRKEASVRFRKYNVGMMTIRDQLTDGGVDPFLFKHERQDERHR